MRVDHALVLSRLTPLDGGTVTGRQQTLHLPGARLTIAAELSQTIKADTYHGVRIRVVSLDHGPLDANWFGFTEHDTFPDASTSQPYGKRDAVIDSYNQDRIFGPGRFRPEQLRDAVRSYLTAFTGMDPTSASAPAATCQARRDTTAPAAARTSRGAAPRPRR